MSRRYDPNNLLATEKLLTADRFAPPPPEPPPAPVKKGKAKAKTKAVVTDEARGANVSFRTTPALKQKIRIAAAQRGVTARELIVEALAKVGLDE